MEQGNYAVLFFDVDDTLFDFDKSQKKALSNMFKECDFLKYVGIQEKYIEINDRLWSQYEQGAITLKILQVERFSKLFEFYNIKLDPKRYSRFYLEFLSESAELFYDVEETIRSLADKYTMGIITNGVAAVQKKRIGNSSIGRYFSEIIISEEFNFSKPQKEIFEIALQKIGFFDKKRILMIGDSLCSDIAGGSNFGIDTCWVNRRMIKNTTGHIPTYEIQNLLQLKKFLLK